MIGIGSKANIRHNSDAKTGNKLILTKALGVGIYSAAFKKGALSRAAYHEFIATTTLLNRVGTELAKDSAVHALPSSSANTYAAVIAIAEPNLAKQSKRPVLGPRQGNLQVRWFVINPMPTGISKADLDKAVRERFASFDGAHHIIDQSRHPGMHETHSIDVICLLQGDASLILEEGETRLKPGQVVIQRGTNHAWQAHGGPALFLAVLIDRELKRD